MGKREEEECKMDKVQDKNLRREIERGEEIGRWEKGKGLMENGKGKGQRANF